MTTFKVGDTVATTAIVLGKIKGRRSDGTYEVAIENMPSSLNKSRGELVHVASQEEPSCSPSFS